MSETGQISDGYHTFDELYEHRHRLFLALCSALSALATHEVWRSRLHSDGTHLAGWFIAGIGTAPGHQITYHLPDRLWPETSWIRELERAPAFDGHTSDDVLGRLKALCP